jgi:hypothetical protein
VQYTVFPEDSNQDPANAITQPMPSRSLEPGEKYFGAVLLDVRHDLPFWDEDAGLLGTGKVHGRKFLRERLGHERKPYEAELHLATEEELLLFADEALEVVDNLAKSFRSAQRAYATAAEKLAKLSPK